MKIVFMGTPLAAVPTLERLVSSGHDVVAVYTQPDRPAGRGNRVAFTPVKEAALRHGLNVLQPEKIRIPEAREEFRSHNADVTVVVAYGRILPEEFLKAFPMGALNVHFSLLPKYRGAAPVSWAIANGERETGVTTMQMDEGLDTGDILLQRSTQIGEEETAADLMDRLAVMGADLLAETLDRYTTLEPLKQDESQASLAPLLKRDDGLIDWSMPADAIANRVRGFQPFPSAFTYLRGMRLTIWRASASERNAGHTPGEVIAAHGDLLQIVCGGGTVLAVQELQLEGKRRLATRDVLNGISLRVGEMLGGPDA